MTEGLHASNFSNFKVGNNTLNTLILSNNMIRNEGAKHLSTIIESNNNKGIKNLDISSNFITDDGGIVIAKALETNTFITRISLRDNLLKDPTGTALSESLKKNKILLKVLLDK